MRDAQRCRDVRLLEAGDAVSDGERVSVRSASAAVGRDAEVHDHRSFHKVECLAELVEFGGE